jgi:catechol 2,3-dioxygenase-like lactoylglutathione lyase family enzyme
MPAQSLNHFTIQVGDLEATKRFYTEIVGLTVGDRPPLDFPGYWLYCGGVPTVHLIYNRTGDKPIEGVPDTGRLDHIAFASTGLRDIRTKLQLHGIKYEERVLPRINMTQLFYRDPDGIAIEMNFSAEETEGRP